MNYKQIRELFIFTSRERNGILVLLFLLILCMVMDWLLPLLIPQKQYDMSGWKAEAEAFWSRSAAESGTEENPAIGTFDPNRVTADSLVRWGVPARLAGTWVNYLEKGGRFRKREEVRKLYGMTEDLYSRLMHHMVPGTEVPHTGSAGPGLRAGRKDGPGIPGRDTLKPVSGKDKVKRELVEVNGADSARLEALPGIGPVLASRILKYRKLLGGFYNKEQLKEVYGMTSELWQKASPFLEADSTRLTMIDINFLSVSELGRHPYIGYGKARKIIRQRDLSGMFEKPADLNSLFSADSLRRLGPYIRFSTGEP